MAPRTGRIEKRIRLAVPIQISSLLNPTNLDRTVTENVCSLGARVLAHEARQLNERVYVSSPASSRRTSARVVYCQRLPGGRFAVGLEFLGMVFEWTNVLPTTSSD